MRDNNFCILLYKFWNLIVVNILFILILIALEENRYFIWAVLRSAQPIREFLQSLNCHWVTLVTIKSPFEARNSMAWKIDYEKTSDNFSSSSVDSDFKTNLSLPAK